MTDPTEIRDQRATERLVQRYGAGKRQRRVLPLVLGGLLVVVLASWAVWAASSQEEPALDAEVTSYDVVGTHEVKVKVAVHVRDSDAGGSCLIRATAEDHTVVGELNLTADELSDAAGSWISVRTERRATTASVARCSD